MDPANGDLVGIIDWADSQDGPRSADFVGLYLHEARLAWIAYDAYGEKPGPDEREWIWYRAFAATLGDTERAVRLNLPDEIAAECNVMARLLSEAP